MPLSYEISPAEIIAPSLRTNHHLAFGDQFSIDGIDFEDQWYFR